MNRKVSQMQRNGLIHKGVKHTYIHKYMFHYMKEVSPQAQDVHLLSIIIGMSINHSNMISLYFFVYRPPTQNIILLQRSFRIRLIKYSACLRNISQTRWALMNYDALESIRENFSWNRTLRYVSCSLHRGRIYNNILENVYQFHNILNVYR